MARFFFQNLVLVIWPICWIFFRSFELFFSHFLIKVKWTKFRFIEFLLKEYKHETKFAKHDHKNKAIQIKLLQAFSAKLMLRSAAGMI